MATLAANRTAKAYRLADVLRDHGADVEAAAGLPPNGWTFAAQLAGVKPPSVETQQVVIELLRHEERIAAVELPDDCLEGLPQ